MAEITDVSSKDFSVSIYSPGELVQGLDDIHQCIYIILTTLIGSDPLRPEFGCGIYKYIDKPVNIATPNMVREVFDALNLWEKRIKVTKVTPQIFDAQVKINIEWTLVGNPQTYTTNVNVRQ